MELLSEIEKVKSFKYNHIFLRFLLAVAAANVIISFSWRESFKDLLQMNEYYIALGLHSLIAFAIIELINWITHNLDRTIPWIVYPGKRLIFQILEGVCFPVILLLILAIPYFGLFGVHIRDTIYFNQCLFLILLMIGLVNAYYIIHYAFLIMLIIVDFNNKKSLTKKIDLTPTLISHWPTQDIALIRINQDGCFVITSENEKLVWPYTLENTINNLPSGDYFLINRSSIVNINNILSANISTSRRFRLILKSPVNEEVFVSQRQNANFKNWLDLNNMRSK